MTKRSGSPSTQHTRVGSVRVIGVLALVALSVSAGACSAKTASSTKAPAGAGVVRPPVVPVQGCTYAPNGSIPAGAPQGIDPHIPVFRSDQTATAALNRIRARGGTGLVYGFSLPAGTKLFAGPDASTAPVTTVPLGRSITVSDPVLWTTSPKARWLAFFLACGGTSPYWASVSQVADVDGPAGDQLTKTIGELLVAAPFTTSGKASALPITIDALHHFAWADPKVPFTVGRGQLVGF